MFFLMITQEVDAYNGGLLEGATGSRKSGSKMDVTKIRNVNDSDLNSFFILPSVEEIVFTFPNEVDIYSYFLKADPITSGSIVYNFYNISGQEVGKPSLTVLNGTKTDFPAGYSYKNVKSLRIFTNTSQDFKIYELDFYGHEVVDPEPVSQIIARPLSISEIEISWTEPDDLHFHGVEILYGSNVFKIAKGTTTFIVGDLPQPNTRYDFKIRSYNNDTGRKSAEQSFFATTLEEEAPPPSEIRNLKSFVYNDRIKFTWDNPDDVMHHEVRIYRDGQQIATAVTPANSFTDYDLMEHTTYTFVFFTVTTDNRRSEGISVTERTKGKPRGKVQGLWAEPLDGGADISWYEHAEAAEGYALYLNNVRTSVSNPFVTLSGLDNGREYTVQVAAVNEWGESERSDPVKFTPEAPIIPGKPQVSAKTTNDSITLSWGRIPHAEGYRIYGQGEDGDFIVSDQSELYFTSYNLGPGVTKTFFVTAYNDVGESERVKVTATTSSEFDFGSIGFAGSVMDVIKTGFGFLSKFGGYILLVLAILFGPTILSIPVWLFRKVSPQEKKSESGKKTPQRATLTPEEKERRARERKLNKARDDKYDYLTRTGRISERDTWVKSVNYLKPEERQQKAREERNQKAREQRATASAGRTGRTARQGRAVRSGR